MLRRMLKQKTSKFVFGLREHVELTLFSVDETDEEPPSSWRERLLMLMLILLRWEPLPFKDIIGLSLGRAGDEERFR